MSYSTYFRFRSRKLIKRFETENGSNLCTDNNKFVIWLDGCLGKF